MSATGSEPNLLVSSDRVSASYRYLRLGIVVMVMMLGVSLAFEIIGAPCRLGSISGYYFTPVHSVFVGSLIAIGMCLVAVKGRNPVEDMFLDIAGVLAAVVALVPTDRPNNTCTLPGTDVTVGQTALVRNNISSLLIALALSVGAAYLFARSTGRVGSMDMHIRKPMAVGLGVSAALLGVGAVWYNAFTTSFLRYAHGSGAVAMFVAAWCAILVNAGWPKGLLIRLYHLLGLSRPEADAQVAPSKFRSAYRFLSLAMPAVALVVAPKWFTWVHRTFWLEAIEITLFGAFWAIHTFDEPATHYTESVR